MDIVNKHDSGEFPSANWKLATIFKIEVDQFDIFSGGQITHVIEVSIDADDRMLAVGKQARMSTSTTGYV